MIVREDVIYNKLSKDKALFRNITGIDSDKFEILYNKLIPVYTSSENKRRKAMGKIFRLSLKDRLLVTLVYYRTYTTCKFMGFIFRVDASTVCRNTNYISKLLLPIFRIPKRKIKISDDELLKIFVDCTEQEINRPKNVDKRKNFYSGKKKRHTVKIQAIVDNNGKILTTSNSLFGKKHDKKIYDKERIIIPKHTKIIGDTAYIGTNIIHPIRKKKGKELTHPQKKYNKKIGSIRVKVEHAFGKMKKFRILGNKFRNPLKTHSIIFKNIAGIVNLNGGFVV